jgi:hypothetical protein
MRTHRNTGTTYQTDESVEGTVYRRWDHDADEVYIERQVTADGVTTTTKTVAKWTDRKAETVAWFPLYDNGTAAAVYMGR